VRQPRDSGSGAVTRARPSSAPSDAGSEQGGGFADNARVTVKHARATPDQKRNLHGVLSECAALGASRDVMVAAVCCVTQESWPSGSGYGDAAGPDSRGLFQQRAPWGPAGPPGPARLDALVPDRRQGRAARMEAEARLAAARARRRRARGDRVQVSVGGYGPVGRGGQAHRRRLGRRERRGRRRRGRRQLHQALPVHPQLRRGLLDGHQAPGQEVGWRCFVVGNSVYYMSEQALYARRVRYEVHPDDPAVLDLTYDVDWGQAGVRGRPDGGPGPLGRASRLGGQLTAGARRTAAGWSPRSRATGSAPTAQVNLVQPGKALLEPANERTQRPQPAAARATSVGRGRLQGLPGLRGRQAQDQQPGPPLHLGRRPRPLRHPRQRHRPRPRPRL
jgi:hypothetical protein